MWVNIPVFWGKATVEGKCLAWGVVGWRGGLGAVSKKLYRWGEGVVGRRWVQWCQCLSAQSIGCQVPQQMHVFLCEAPNEQRNKRIDMKSTAIRCNKMER